MTEHIHEVLKTLERQRHQLSRERLQIQEDLNSLRERLAALGPAMERLDTAIEVIREQLGMQDATPDVDTPRLALDSDSEAANHTEQRWSPDMTIADAALTVLRESGESLKTREIVDELLATGFQYDKPPVKLGNAVGIGLARAAQKTGEVVKIGTGKWRYIR